MSYLKLSSTDAFVVTDLDGAERSTGIVRRARKILPDGARLLARSTTYSWAVLGRQISGASAGINADDDAADAAVSSFTTELLDAVSSGSLSLDAGKGVRPEDLATLDAVDRRNGVRSTVIDGAPVDAQLLAAGVVAVAAACGGLDGRTVVIEGAGNARVPLQGLLESDGAVVLDCSEADALSTAADVLVCGSKAGLIDHQIAAQLPHRVVVPVGPVPVTARGLAVAARRDIVVLPDFVTTLGPLIGWDAPEGTPFAESAATARDTVTSLVERALAHDESPTLGACAIAEAFLRTWQESLPFGRPMA
ncbi:MAG: hypothetical protein ACKOYM_02430 [Actinomycetes bacterium]